MGDKAREPTQKFELYPHQVEALKLTKGKTRVAYYYDMGLGKSYIGSEKAKEINQKTLLVCQKTKLKDWQEHYEKYYDFKVYDLTKGVDEFINEPSVSVGIINYDLLIRRPKLLYLSNFTLMLDESSLIGNVKTSRTKYILKMRPYSVILLSGTPNRYENLWSQCYLLGWEIKPYEYNSRYINYELKDFKLGYPVKVIKKSDPYKNVEELKEKLRVHNAVFMKSDDVIDLPAQNFIDVKVARSKEYTKFLKDRIITLDDCIELVGDQAFKNYLYKRQLCSVYNQEKLMALNDLLDSTDDRVIIFYNWNMELSAIKKTITDKPISEVNGHIRDLTNYEKCSDSITLVQYQAGALGLNLQLANKIIFFTPTDKSELYQQAIKRIHRIGQERPCFYYRLIVEKSIEVKVYESLERQQDFTDYLFEED